MAYTSEDYKGLTIVTPDPTNAGAVIVQNNTKAIADTLESLQEQLNEIELTPGTSGYSGYSGFSGTSGYSGYSGISGFSGYSGFSGISGFSGYSGFSGISGFSGYSGYSGISGFSGYSGYSGFSGLSGFSGYSGYSGVQANIDSIAWTGGAFFHNDSDDVDYDWGRDDSVGAETLTIYTCPASHKAMILAVYAYNANASSRTVEMQWTRSGTTRLCDNSGGQNVSTVTSQNIGTQYWPLLKAGDTLEAVVSGSDVSVVVRVLLVPDTYNIDDFIVSSISASGTLYTCPVNRSALLLQAQNWQPTNNGSFVVFNSTGSTTAITSLNVPSGESADNAYILRSQNVNNNQMTTINQPVYLNAGDTLRYTASVTGTGFIYGIFVEFA